MDKAMAMDERTFLLSEAYRQYLERVVRTVSGMYDVQVVFSHDIQTDGRVIQINPLSPLLAPLPTLEQKTLAILGQLAHEYFHIAYTDFRAFRLLPAKMRQETPFRREAAYRLLNIVEDAAVERRGCEAYRGLFRRALAFSNHVAFSQMPAIDEMQRRGVPAFQVLVQATLMQAVLGRVKGTWLDASLEAVFARAIPILEEGQRAPDSMARLRQAEKLYQLYLPWIKDMEETGMSLDDAFPWVKPVWRLTRHGRETPFPAGPWPEGSLPAVELESESSTRAPEDGVGVAGVESEARPAGDAISPDGDQALSVAAAPSAAGSRPPDEDTPGKDDAGSSHETMSHARSDDGWRWDEELGHRVARPHGGTDGSAAFDGSFSADPFPSTQRAVQPTEVPAAESPPAAGGPVAKSASANGRTDDGPMSETGRRFRWKWFRFGRNRRPGGRHSRQMVDADAQERARRSAADTVKRAATADAGAQAGAETPTAQQRPSVGARGARAATEHQRPTATERKRPAEKGPVDGGMQDGGTQEGSVHPVPPSAAEPHPVWETDLRQVADALVAVRAAAVQETKAKADRQAMVLAMRQHGERLARGLHHGIRVFANRNFAMTPHEREQFLRLEAETRWLAQSMSRQWQQWLLGEQPVRESGLYSGKLDERRLWRHDTRLFYRRSGAAASSDLAILLLVDESGSMNEADRWHHAQRACLVLEAVCRVCGWPLAVLGHLAVYGEPHVVHNHYLDFGPRTAQQRERLILLGPKENTREGLSLRYAARYIREAERRGWLSAGPVRPLILSVSDGRPVHDAGPWTLKGEMAQDDVRAAVRELERDGIHVVGVAIGDESSAIGDVYNHALEVRRVEDLPQRLLRTLRQWLETTG